MGNQQLLLIVLGTIVVGIAVIVGINQFRSYYEISAIDEMQQELIEYTNMAIQYYKKPKVLGGGGNSFRGFKLSSNLAATEVGYYGLSVISDNHLNFSAATKDLRGRLKLDLKHEGEFLIKWTGEGLPEIIKRTTADYKPL